MPKTNKTSAGILLYRITGGALQFLLVHPGGPFYARKDAGVWSIPKGEIEDSEADPLATAIREFQEETGFELSVAGAKRLQPVRIKSGKVIHAWAVKGEADPSAIRSNRFEMEWPPRSGRMASFPEADRAQWFSLSDARVKINAGQVPLLDELAEMHIGAG